MSNLEFPEPDSPPVICPICCALVPYFSTDKHDEWHEKLGK